MKATAEPIDALATEISQELAVVDAQPPALFGTTDPVEIVGKARDVANALKDVLKVQGMVSNIQGKEYVKCEGWTLLGSMLGIFPVNVWTREVEGGWEARVEARTMGGSVVGAAEAQCTRAEKMWSSRDPYALRSMAQTRATSKALRMPLGFVVTLAGYMATPAEEMTFSDPHSPAASLAHAQENATDKQVGYIKKLLREEIPPDELDGFIKGLATSYPHAIVGGKLVIIRLTKGEAGELIELIQSYKPRDEQIVDMADLPNEGLPNE